MQEHFLGKPPRAICSVGLITGYSTPQIIQELKTRWSIRQLPITRICFSQNLLLRSVALTMPRNTAIVLPYSMQNFASHWYVHFRAAPSPPISFAICSLPDFMILVRAGRALFRLAMRMKAAFVKSQAARLHLISKNNLTPGSTVMVLVFAL